MCTFSSLYVDMNYKKKKKKKKIVFVKEKKA